jgi:hypothetical protein
VTSIPAERRKELAGPRNLNISRAIEVRRRCRP